jgi:hypothetical protein
VEGQVDEVAPLPIRQRFALPPPQDKLGEDWERQLGSLPDRQLSLPALSYTGLFLFYPAGWSNLFALRPSPAAPARRPRRQWTPDRQRRFLAALLETGNISHAAQLVGMSRSSAHRLRDRLAGTGFDRSWASALALHAARLADPLAPIRPRRGPIGR